MELPASPTIGKKVKSFPCLPPVEVDTDKPRVLVLFCGGTLIMRPDADGVLNVNEDIDEAVDQILNFDPKIGQVANLSVQVVENIDSTDMRPEIWDKLGTVINEEYDNYEGFVITHGTDTMAYTASALSFTLCDLGKPVVLTGSQIPGGRIATDARRNFVNAVRVATLNKAGVMIVFDVDILLGSRATKVSESKLDAFRQMNWSLLGEIRTDIQFSQDARERHDRPLIFRPGFECRVVVFTLFPGFPATIIDQTIRSGNVRGIILQGFGSGNLSENYLGVVQLAHEYQIPVVITTQCLEGSTRMHWYRNGKQFLDFGAIQAFDM